METRLRRCGEAGEQIRDGFTAMGEFETRQNMLDGSYGMNVDSVEGKVEEFRRAAQHWSDSTNPFFTEALSA